MKERKLQETCLFVCLFVFETLWYVGVCAVSHPHVVIQRDARGAEGRQYVGAALISWPTAVVRMGPHEVRTDLYICAAHIPYTKNVIEEG